MVVAMDIAGIYRNKIILPIGLYPMAGIEKKAIRITGSIEPSYKA
jgi:hypothetical protein